MQNWLAITSKHGDWIKLTTRQDDQIGVYVSDEQGTASTVLNRQDIEQMIGWLTAQLEEADGKQHTQYNGQ